MFSEEYSQALNAYHDAVHRAYEAWIEHRHEPWPGTFYMSAKTRAELGIPERPKAPERDPLPPHLDENSPEFDPPRLLHPSMLSETARARVAAQQEAIAEAEAAVTSVLEADFAAWTGDPEPEAEI